MGLCTKCPVAAEAGLSYRAETSQKRKETELERKNRLAPRSGRSTLCP